MKLAPRIFSHIALVVMIVECVIDPTPPAEGRPRLQPPATGLNHLVQKTRLGDVSILPTDDGSPCTAAIQVAWGASVALGCEDPAPRSPNRRLHDRALLLTGSIVEGALTQVAGIYAKYEWTDYDTVPVLRPTAAVRDPNHFLNTPVQPLPPTVVGVDDAWQTIARSLGLAMTLPPSAAAHKTFALSFPGGSLLDLLNAIVRARGEVVWHVSYVTPDRPREPLNGRVYLALLPSDEDAVGGLLPNGMRD